MRGILVRRSATPAPRKAQGRVAMQVTASMAAGLLVAFAGAKTTAVTPVAGTTLAATMFNVDPGLELDYSGDGATDYTVVRNTGGGPTGAITWFTQGHLGFSATQWGIATDYFLAGDYDNDNKADVAVWRNGTFYVRRSSNGTLLSGAWGTSGDDPTIPGDYDGDGKTDFAVYRGGLSSGQQSYWYALGSLSGTVTAQPWGQNGDFPAPGDYDGDGKADFAIQRNFGGGQAVFWIRTAVGVISNVQFGTPTDVIVPGDYDGDNKTDIAVIRGQGGQIIWYIRRSLDGAVQAVAWGISATDFPTQGDYDGDGITDLAIFRPSATPGQSGFWVRRSSGGFHFWQFGANGDYPVANYNSH